MHRTTVGMSDRIICEDGNGTGKAYAIDPNGHVVLVTPGALEENRGRKANAGWRYATKADLAPKSKPVAAAPAPAAKPTPGKSDEK